MKTLILCFCFSFVLFSCKTKSGFSPPSEELFDLELVFNEEEKLKPMSKSSECDFDKLSEPCTQLQDSIRNEVYKRIKSLDSKIPVDKKQIRVYYEVSVFLEGLNLAQKDLILKNLERLDAKDKGPGFKLQLSKPIMQSEEYLKHAQKPQMQEQLDYDPENKISLLIELVGGGEPNTNPTDGTVWIIDSGIDKSHQDLTTINESLSEDYSNDGGPFNDETGHGTFIAGIIGGLASSDPIYADSYGINGMVPGANMVSLKIFKVNPQGKYFAKSQWIESALDHISAKAVGKNVVNISWGMDLDLGEDCAIDELKSISDRIIKMADEGIMFSISAGNHSEDSMGNFPGCISNPNIYTLGSIKVKWPTDYLFSSTSNFGMPSIDYLTPGENLFTTAPGGDYAQVSGTSFSAAIFSGILYSQKEIGILTEIPIDPTVPGAGTLYPIAKIKDE